jgi:hypothetical protein
MKVAKLSMFNSVVELDTKSRGADKNYSSQNQVSSEFKSALIMLM